jgi:cytochrome bd-type quinol oxidase subunit 2
MPFRRNNKEIVSQTAAIMWDEFLCPASLLYKCVLATLMLMVGMKFFIPWANDDMRDRFASRAAATHGFVLHGLSHGMN